MATESEVSTTVGVRELLDAGLHFGHQTKRWNPKMKPYIFDKRNGIHIVDLSKSLVMLNEAMKFVAQIVLGGKSVLFVGTKKQAQQAIKETATACGQFYVTHRWLGGTLTNATTIRRSVKRMKELADMEKNGAFESMHKQEAARLRHELEKLRRNLSGIAGMGELPGAMFVVDVMREAIAVAEANTLNIPVVAMVDTCCDPDPIQYVIPGNDDAIRAIKLVAGAIGETVSKASAEYAKIAAEVNRRREEEEKRRAEERQKAAEAAAQRAEAAAKEKAAKARAARKDEGEGAAAAGAEGEAKPAARKRTTKKAAPESAPAEAPAPEAAPAPAAEAPAVPAEAPAVPAEPAAPAAAN